MSVYPDGHHPVFFLISALKELGVDVEFARDERTCGTWGMIVNGKPVSYLIDNRHDHERVKEDPAAKEMLARGNLVCHAQPPDRDRVGGKWLPLAVSPGYTTPPQPVKKLWDCAFVGFVRTESRADFLCEINAHYSLSSVSGTFGAPAIETYWQARVGVNVPTSYGSPTGYDTFNMRAAEILATGTPLITAYEPWLEELGLIPGVNYMPYTTIAEALAAVKHCIAHPEIGVRGAELAQARHLYSHRAKQVLEWLA